MSLSVIKIARIEISASCQSLVAMIIMVAIVMAVMVVIVFMAVMVVLGRTGQERHN